MAGKSAKEGQSFEQRLCDRVRADRKNLEKPRRIRREIVAQTAGPLWGNQTIEEAKPLNLASTYQKVMSSLLVPGNPRISMKTFDTGIRDHVAACEKAVNKEIESQNLQEVFQELVIDAFAGFSVAKVCLSTPGDARKYNWNEEAGTAYIHRVDLDDFVYDTRARSFRDASYIGHRYRVSAEWVRKSKLFHKDRSGLQADDPKDYNETGDLKVEVMGRGQDSEEGEIEDHVTLWEFWVPSQGKIYTFRDSDGDGPIPEQDGKPLRVQPWIGPKEGPYHILGYSKVVGNALPKGPLQDLIPLDVEANRNLRKALRQADRMKSMTLVNRNAADTDGERLKNASDGDIVPVDDPKNFQQIVTGGAEQTVVGITMQLKELFSWAAGGLDALAGLGPQAKTATQEKLLHESANRQVSDMQSVTSRFITSVLRAWCWYWWHDPVKTIKTTYEVEPGSEFSVPVEVTPEDRMKGSFDDLDIIMDPFSLSFSSPASMDQELDQLVMQIILPMMPLLKEQGVVFDTNEYLSLKAKYRNNPDFSRIISIHNLPMEEAQGESHEAKPGSPVTSREYVRKSESEATPQGQAQNMIAQLMTGNSQGGAPSSSGGMPA